MTEEERLAHQKEREAKKLEREAKAKERANQIPREVVEEVVKTLVAEKPELKPEIESAARAVIKVKKEKEKDKRRQERLANVQPPNQYCRIELGDITKWEEQKAFGIQSQSIDAIITDPPYGKDALPLYDYLGGLAKYALKPNASLFVMVGQSYLPTILEALSRHLTYHWTIAYVTPGGQAPHLWTRNVNSFWKPILWFVNGVYNGPCVGDKVESPVNNNDKDFHNWGQSEAGMVALIQAVTKTGDLLLDPFLGAGTTGIASRLGRGFIGVDNSEEAVALSNQRLGRD
jgi:site-specific DNA-methyltransferase (adenine-specific)